MFLYLLTAVAYYFSILPIFHDTMKHSTVFHRTWGVSTLAFLLLVVVIYVFQFDNYLHLRINLKSIKWKNDKNTVLAEDENSRFQLVNLYAAFLEEEGHSEFAQTCLRIVQGQASVEEVVDAIEVKRHREYYFKNELAHSGEFPSCKDYFAQHAHFEKLEPVTEEEKNFPVAFGILIYRNFDQFEQLFRMIYRPQNFYCIHIDEKSSPTFKTTVRQLTDCFPANVFTVPIPIEVYWGSPSILKAELECMKMLLLQSRKWKYYINLTGEEFPLVTNLELVSILRRLGGANMLEKSKRINKNRFPEEMPNGLEKYKSAIHLALSADAVNFILTNKTVSYTLLNALLSYPYTEESYYAVLQFNLHSKTGFPGGMLEKYKRPKGEMRPTRHVLWSKHCPSNYSRHSVCMLGIRDLPEIVGKSYGLVLAANKFLWPFQPMAWDCMQVWHYARMVNEYKTRRVAMNVSKYLDRSYFDKTHKYLRT